MKEDIFITLSAEELKMFIKDSLNEVLKERVLEQSITQDEIFNAKEAAKYLKISNVTLWKWRKANKVPYFKIGRSIKYRKSEIDKALIDERKKRSSR